MPKNLNRRGFLGKSATVVGAAGLATAAGVSLRSSGSSDDNAAERSSGADSGGAQPEKVVQKKEMPQGKIGKLSISRMILGSNLMGGHSHARDLRYVGPLMRAYNTEEKILETLAIAEAEGINTISQGDRQLVQKYNDVHGGRMQQLGPLRVRSVDKDEEIKTAIKKLVDDGYSAIYIFGHDSDLLVRASRTDIIANTIGWIKDEGLPAGVGGHSLNVVIDCEQEQVNPDFYFKTFHSDRYWSATMKEHRDEYCWYNGVSNEAGKYHDNMWCVDPDRTVEVMKNVQATWIAFKVLAAGALHPKREFSYAVRSGADFIVVGMFDFQVEQNAALARKVFNSARKRDRAWYA